MISLTVDRANLPQFSKQDLDTLFTTIKAIVYARVSTQDQAKHGYSLESQIDRCVTLAREKYGIREDGVLAIIEHGEMGDDPTRPGLNQALSFVEQGIGTKFIVLHPDRLARDLKLQLYVTERIWNAGCDIAFVEMDVNPNNPESILLYNIQGAIAQYNKAKILANSKRGRRTKVMNGRIPGVRRVYGYAFDKDEDMLVENHQEKTTYLLMVDWLLHGLNGMEMNLTSIARELSLLGVPAPNGDKWYQATVSRILRNPVYTGIFYYGKTEITQKGGKKRSVSKPVSEWQGVEVPSYIDDVTFHRIQQKLASLARTNRGARPRVSYILKGLARCGRCGGAVVAGSPSRNKTTGEVVYHYYVCSRKARKVFEVGTGREVHACRGRNWRQDVVDAHVWRYVIYCLRGATDGLQEIRRKNGRDKHVVELRERKERLERSADEKEAERKRWLQLRAKGRITDEELEQELGPLLQDIQLLKEKVDLIDDRLKALDVNREETELIRQDVRQFQDFIEEKILHKDQRQIVRLLIKQVVLHDEQIEIYTSWDAGHSHRADIRTCDGDSHNLNHRQDDGLNSNIFITGP